jgi:hypothetical protein
MKQKKFVAIILARILKNNKSGENVMVFSPSLINPAILGIALIHRTAPQSGNFVSPFRLNKYRLPLAGVFFSNCPLWPSARFFLKVYWPSETNQKRFRPKMRLIARFSPSVQTTKKERSDGGY